MDRKKALQKLSIVCRRLEAVDPEQFFVVPLRVYLFGSLLTNKPNPTDVGLLFQYRERERSEREVGQLLYALTYGKPLPHNRAISHLRKGMKMVRFELLSADSSPELWLRSHWFDPKTPIKLIWKRGYDWKKALQEVETQPVEWDPAIEERNKYVQETAKRIEKEQGLSAVADWMQSLESAGKGDNS